MSEVRTDGQSRMRAVYVRVDSAKCCGYTVCADKCPEVFKLDERGMSYVDDERVPDGLEEKATNAARSCPERAIRVSERPFDE